MFLNNFWLKIGKEKVEMAYYLNYFILSAFVVAQQI